MAALLQIQERQFRGPSRRYCVTRPNGLPDAGQESIRFCTGNLIENGFSNENHTFQRGSFQKVPSKVPSFLNVTPTKHLDLLALNFPKA